MMLSRVLKLSEKLNLNRSIRDDIRLFNVVGWRVARELFNRAKGRLADLCFAHSTLVCGIIVWFVG